MQKKASHQAANPTRMPSAARGTLMARYAMERHPVRSRNADWSQPKKPGRATKGSGSSICSSRSPRASWRWNPPNPLAIRTESARTASPKNVMARTMPANRVPATQAKPTAARGAPMARKENSDHERLVNGSRQMRRAISLARSERPSMMVVTISLDNARIRLPTPSTCSPMCSVGPGIMRHVD
jgi:hypothetical protein